MYRAINENHDHQTLNEQSLRNVLSVIFLLKKVPERIVTSNLVGEGRVSYTDAGKKRFQNVIPVCVLLRKNFQNCVLACSVTKIPLNVLTLLSLHETYNAQNFLLKIHNL
jgi:hypothetical protein